MFWAILSFILAVSTGLLGAYTVRCRQFKRTSWPFTPEPHDDHEGEYWCFVAALFMISTLFVFVGCYEMGHRSDQIFQPNSISGGIEPQPPLRVLIDFGVGPHYECIYACCAGLSSDSQHPLTFI
jgi:hypothetical protein